MGLGMRARQDIEAVKYGKLMLQDAVGRILVMREMHAARRGEETGNRGVGVRVVGFGHVTL
jgi:hypothetical protein